MIQRSKVTSVNPPLSVEVKKCYAVGYLCELGIELCLGLDENVSESPGFEAFTGVHS